MFVQLYLQSAPTKSLIVSSCDGTADLSSSPVCRQYQKTTAVIQVSVQHAAPTHGH